MKNLISVIICTHNRSDSLKETLNSLLDQKCDDSFEYEIIVVDNNSKDSTKEAIESYSSKFDGRLKYLFESIQGKSHALNTGIKAAKGEIIAFTDDDCIVDKNRLAEIVSAFKNYNADAVLGKVTLVISFEKPEWIPDWFLKKRLAHVDYGNKTIRIDNEDLVGANMSFRAEVFSKYGGFNTDVGLCGDTDFSRRIQKKGIIKFYCPTAQVFHRVASNRLRNRYFFKQSYQWGKITLLLEPPDISSIRLFIWIVKRVIKNTSVFIVQYLRRDKERCFLTQCRICIQAGSLHQLVIGAISKLKENFCQ